MRSITSLVCVTVLWLIPCNALADARADFLKMIDRAKVPLAAEVSALPATRPIEEFHFTFASDGEQRVPGVLVKSEAFSGRRPVVIALHGTGGNKMGELPLLRILAARGFIGVAIDGRYHGERAASGKGTVDYEQAIVRAWEAKDGLAGHPFFYDTVWDVMRLIDYLQTREDVDAGRIGVYGVSKGGIEAYLAAAVDTRIGAAVPCIGMESFKWALDHDDWQGRIGTIQNAFDTIAKEEGGTAGTGGTELVRKFYAKVAPGIDGEFDGPAMIRLIAPRPLMIVNSDSDPHTPVPGVELCVGAGKEAYGAAGAEERFVSIIQAKTGHKVNADSQAAGVEWLVRWMKP